MIYIKKKDRELCKQYNNLINDKKNKLFDDFEKRNRKKYTYGFIFKNEKDYEIRCSYCNNIMRLSKAKSNQKCICSNCKAEMTLTRRAWIKNEDWLSYVEKINDDLYVARYFYYRYIFYRDRSDYFYDDEVKREFYSKKNGLEFACYKGMHDFYSTIIFDKRKYDTWMPCHKYPYYRCAGGRNINSLFCPELMPQFDGKFKYCSFKEVAENGWYTCFRSHMDLYRYHKEMELAIKSKWKNGYYCIEDLKGKIDFKDKKFLKKCIKNDYDDHNYFLANYEVREEDVPLLIKCHSSVLEEVLAKYGYNNTIKAIKRNYDLYTWKDYLGALEILDVPLNKDVMFPRDLNEAHDRTMERKRAVETKVFDKKIKKYARELNINITNDKYTVIVPTSSKEIIQEGEQQHNCVGKMGYIEKMAKHETIICFLRKTQELSKSFVTIELDPQRKYVRQAYIHNNHECPKEAMNFIKKMLLVA